MQLEGITWHALTLQPDALEATKKLLTETLGVPVAMELGGAVVFSLQNGTLLELYTPDSTPAFGYTATTRSASESTTSKRAPQPSPPPAASSSETSTAFPT